MGCRDPDYLPSVKCVFWSLFQDEGEAVPTIVVAVEAILSSPFGDDNKASS